MHAMIRNLFALALCCLFAGVSVAEAEDTTQNTTQDAAKDARQPAVFKNLTAAKDADGDFLVDAFETQLINTYAPYFIFHTEETAWPSSASHHLANSLQLRMYRKDKEKEFFTDAQTPKPTTWAQVKSVFVRNARTSKCNYHDLYFALPIDKTLLKPGDPMPLCPKSDFRFERSGEKSIHDVYRSRVMIPKHRPLSLDVTFIEAGGDVYTGSVTLPIFSTEGKIKDEFRSEFFKATCGSKERQVQLQLSDVRKALGLDGESPLPNGAMPDWTEATVFAVSRTDRLEATYVPRHGSAQTEWIKGGRKQAVYFSAGAVSEVSYDVNAAKALWQAKLPNPTAGAEIYAHVFPTANYVVVQYWPFYGYTDHEREEHEADWGDHIDVVLYRNDPEGTATNATSKPLGVIPAYRDSKPLNQRMVAMVVYYGSSGRIVFKRDPKAPTTIVESRSKLSFGKARQLRWCGSNGLIAAGASHPIVYVAKGCHQMYPQGGTHKRKPPVNKFKKLINLVSGTDLGVDKCSPDAPNNRFAADVNPARVLPQTTAKAFTGQATYKDGDASVTLSGTGTSIRLVNVGELSSPYRELLMRLDSKVGKELTKSWGHTVPAESEATELMKNEIRATFRTKLEAQIKSTLAAIKEEEAASAKADTTTKTKTPTTKKKSLKVKAEERVKQIRSKLWTEIVAAKNDVKKTYKTVLDTVLNDLVEEVIQDVLGIKPVKPQLMLSKTKPMAGAEFLDYPGHWGRLLATASMSKLETQQAAHFLEYEMPDDDQMLMLRKWRWSGPVGPTGAKPERYLRDFYRDYDTFAKQVLVYGVEIDL